MKKTSVRSQRIRSEILVETKDKFYIQAKKKQKLKAIESNDEI